MLADEAARENANIQLQRCTIVSPVTGPAVAGLDFVKEGNLVTANDMVLVVINQIDPVEVFFSVPEADFPLVKKYMKSGGEKLEVRVKPRGQEAVVIRGELTALDNAVDATSGTIRLAATFENKDERLWPGDYVDVTLKLTTEDDALVAPARAVQVGRDNKYVYVIKPDNTAEVRPVVVRRISMDEVVVEQGLRKDERVVTDGQLRLTDGTKVEVVEETEKAAARLGGHGEAASADAGGSKAAAAGSRLMNISALFIRRPIMTTLVMASLLLFGIMAYVLLPVSDLPNVDFPTIYVTTLYPGASADTMAASVATPLEKEFSTIAGVDNMTSASLQGTTQITLQFALTRNIDAAAQDVQAAITRAQRNLPTDLPGRRPSTARSTPPTTRSSTWR